MFINLIKRENGFYVSSLEIAEKFGKRHKNILRDIETLGTSEQFGRLNFEPSNYTNSQGKNMPMFLLTRDGFSILAMGFIGKEAMEWKEKFIEAFNQMEQTIKEQIPLLQQEIQQLKAQQRQLPPVKLPHKNKGTVIVPVPVNTLYGTDIEYRRVKKNDNRISDISYKEGELKRLSQICKGLSSKIDRLTHEIAKDRRR